PGPPRPTPIGVYTPLPAPEKPLPTMAFGLDVGFIAPAVGQFTSGAGIYAYYERRISDGLMLDIHAGYLYHPPNTPFDATTTFSSNEGLIVAGVRTLSHSAVYGLAQLGTLIYQQDESMPGDDVSFSGAFPVFVVGGGLRTGRLHIEAVAVYAISTSSDVD